MPNLKALGLSLALVVIAVAVYGWLWSDGPWQRSDSPSYLVPAADLADGSLDKIHFRSPGYPALLALTGSAGPSGKPGARLLLTSLTLHFMAVALLAWALMALGVGKLGVGVFVLLGSLPPNVQFAALVLSETLTEFLLAVALALLLVSVRTDRLLPAAGSGVFFGLATLARPTYQAAALGLALVILTIRWIDGRRRSHLRRPWGTALALTLASALVVLSFAAWNHARFGHFVISPGNLGWSLSTKTVRVLERLPEEYATEREVLIEERDRQLVERGSSHTAQQYLDQARPLLTEATGLEGLELEARILELNWVLIRTAPLNYLWEVLRSVPTFWFPVAGDISTFGHRGLLAIWAGLHFAVLTLFGLQLLVLSGALLIALTRRLRTPRKVRRSVDQPVIGPELTPYLLATALVAYTLAISCGVHHGEPRFRVPVELPVFFLTVLGSHYWWRLADPREGR